MISRVCTWKTGPSLRNELRVAFGDCVLGELVVIVAFKCVSAAIGCVEHRVNLRVCAKFVVAARACWARVARPSRWDAAGTTAAAAAGCCLASVQGLNSLKDTLV